jgi:hypothetical protein
LGVPFDGRDGAPRRAGGIASGQGRCRAPEQGQAAEERQRQDPDTPGEGGAVAAGREPQRQEPDTPGEGGAVAAGKGAMTRSEQEVRRGKRTRERGRARLKKYVVTDYVDKKIPVKREEVRLEREPPAE